MLFSQMATVAPAPPLPPLDQLELDSSFVDAQMQGKNYSTAMAILTLLEDLKQISR